MSITILLKPIRGWNLNTKRLNDHNFKLKIHNKPITDSNLISFYSYLTALSFCDLFSCIFAILNVLEYLLPNYLEFNSFKYHVICLKLQIYTLPIATTLQALSCWLICAFSIHRCRSIVKTTNISSFLSKDNFTDNCFKKYFRPILSRFKLADSIKRSKNDNQNNCEKSEISIYNMSTEEVLNSSKFRRKRFSFSKFSILNKARLVIILLYMFSIIYLIPQWFEKKLTNHEIQNKTYVFLDVTEFGKSNAFKQIFHLWFYWIAIYILPFMLILFFNLILLNSFLDSKNKCKQYKLKNDANQIIKEYNSFDYTMNAHLRVNNKKEAPQIISKSLNNLLTTDRVTCLSNDINDLRDNVSVCSDNLIHQINPKTAKRSILTNGNRQRLINKSTSLTLTLFGVVAIFFICHLPAAIMKIVYVLYPRLEFDNFMASFFLDLSNFLIMLNSSINFLLYIVFGPAKFRQEFSLLLLSFFKCFSSKRNKAQNNANRIVASQSSQSLKPVKIATNTRTQSVTSSFHNNCSIQINNEFLSLNKINHSFCD